MLENITFFELKKNPQTQYQQTETPNAEQLTP